MSFDHLVEDAIKKAVEEANQPETLAVKVIAWVTALASGNESQDDADSTSQRVRLLYEAVDVKDEEEEE